MLHGKFCLLHAYFSLLHVRNPLKVAHPKLKDNTTLVPTKLPQAQYKTGDTYDYRVAPGGPLLPVKYMEVVSKESHPSLLCL